MCGFGFVRGSSLSVRVGNYIAERLPSSPFSRKKDISPEVVQRAQKRAKAIEAGKEDRKSSKDKDDKHKETPDAPNTQP